MHIRSPSLKVHKLKPKPHSSHVLDFSTIPEQPTSTFERKTPIYDYLLNICVQQCKKIQSRRLFDEMPHRISYVARLSRAIHARSLVLGFGSKGQLGNSIVDLYGKCGQVDLAQKAFDRLEDKAPLAWNSILSMYSRREMLEHVLQSFSSMQNSGVVPNQFTYAIVFSVCARLVDIDRGKQVHCSVIKMGLELNSFCQGSLIDMYAKCGNLVDSRRVFDGSVDPDTVSWTAMIAGYVHGDLAEKALEVFEQMQKVGQIPDQVAVVTVMSACLRLGRLDYACRLFSQMPNRNAVAWSVIISGHAKSGYEDKAVKFFQNMASSGVKPTRSSLGSVLSAVASLSNVDYGLQIHAHSTKLGLDSNVYVGSSLVNMYAKCRRVEAAKEVFNSLKGKNIVLWNAMLGAYAQNGYFLEVLDLFTRMRSSGHQPDEFTYTSILSACACLESIKLGCQLHSFIIKNKFELNLYVGNALVDMYAKCGALNDARQQFELIKYRDNVSWNAIIVGYAQDEEEEEAFSMFQRMRLEGIVPDEVSLASILSACANIRALDKGKQTHCFLLKLGLETSLYAGSSLIGMYAKCGVIKAAKEVFNCMPERSVASINALIAGYTQKEVEKAVDLFQSMLALALKPSEVTFASLLDACCGPSRLNLGRQIHCQIIKVGLSYANEFLAVSLLTMYMDSQSKTDAMVLFSEFLDPKSTVLWTVIISGNIQNDRSDEALLLYQEMRSCNALPDQATFASVLKACATLSSLKDGRELHSLIFHTGFDLDELIGSALVDMYAKCGDVKSSAQVFGEMFTKKDVISWNSMIVGFAKNGYVENALDIFNQMIETQVEPDGVTFLGILTACSHAGRISTGREIFAMMVNRYGIQPRADHCACMIDLFGRCGLLKEAGELINTLQFEPDAMIWATYLGACSIHGDETRGLRAAEKLIELEPQNSSPYVLLSNIYAASRNWNGVNSVRRIMKENGVKKFPGCSWIVVGQKTNSFIAGDKIHPSAPQIYSVLKKLTALLKDEDYIAQIESLGEF